MKVKVWCLIVLLVAGVFGRWEVVGAATQHLDVYGWASIKTGYYAPSTYWLEITTVSGNYTVGGYFGKSGMYSHTITRDGTTVNDRFGYYDVTGDYPTANEPRSLFGVNLTCGPGGSVVIVWDIIYQWSRTGGNYVDVHHTGSFSGVVPVAGGEIVPLSVSVSGDATPYVDESVQFTHTVTGGLDSHYGYWEVYNSGGGLEYGGSQVANGTALTYSFGHAGYHDVTYTAIDSDNSTAHGHFMTTAYEDALDCSLSGPSQAAVNVPVNFTATGSGGVVHAGDSYDYRLGTRFGADAVSYGAWGTSGTLS
jgi:hypothetical protein